MQDIRELIQNGQIEQADHMLRDRLNDNPDDPEALNMYGVVLSRKGDLLGARSYFKRALEAAPDEPGYMVNYGLLLAQQGDSLRAAEFLQRAAALDPNWSRGHAQLGELALASGQIDEAEQRFKTALRADPDDAHAKIGLAQICQVRGDTDKALTLAQEAIADLPKDARAQSVLGTILLAKGHTAFARQALDNALALEPKNRRIQRMAARARLADNDAAAAMALVRRMAEFDGEDLPLLAELCDQALGKQLYAELIDVLDRALVRVPHEPRLIHAAAEARARSGRTDDAISLLGAYSSAEAHPSIWAHRLGLLAQRQRYDEAFELAQAWAAAQPQHADAHAELATGAELRGDSTLARKSAERALALDAKQPKALMLAAGYEIRSGKPGPHCKALAARETSDLNAPAKATRGFVLGMAADRQGDSDTAVSHWLQVHAQMQRQRMPALADPLGPPRELPMPLAQAPGRPVVFVPQIPGSGAEALIKALMQGKAITVLSDRLSGAGRHDGLAADQRSQIEKGLGESTLQLFRRRYWRAFDRLKLPAGRPVLDVLPSLEWVQYAALSGALPQARVLAFVRDPRDVLLHWLAYGTSPARPIPQPELAANYLLRQYQHLDRMRSSAGLAVTVIRGEDFDADPNALRERLGQVLGVSADSLLLEAPRKPVLAGLPDRLESGRWRQYAAPLGKAFRLLAPAARSFDYS